MKKDILPGLQVVENSDKRLKRHCISPLFVNLSEQHC